MKYDEDTGEEINDVCVCGGIKEDETIISLTELRELQSQKTRLKELEQREEAKIKLIQQLEEQYLKLQKEYEKVKNENIALKKGIIGFIKKLGGE